MVAGEERWRLGSKDERPGSQDARPGRKIETRDARMLVGEERSGHGMPGCPSGKKDQGTGCQDAGQGRKIRARDARMPVGEERSGRGDARPRGVVLLFDEGGRIAGRGSPVSLYVGLQHRRGAQINGSSLDLLLQAAPYHPHLVACGLAAAVLVVQEG